MKIVVTRGIGWVPLMSGKEEPHTTMIIFVSPLVGVFSEEMIRKGARLRSTTMKRTHPDNLDPRIKSVNYQANVLMRREAAKEVPTKLFRTGMMGMLLREEQTIFG